MSKTLVKFGFGLAAKYEVTSMTGMIYFATDTNEIFLNGTAYGYSSADAAVLDKSIKSITLGADQKTITITANDDTTSTLVLKEASASLAGLMSADDKVALDTLNGDVTKTGSVKKQIADAKADLEGTIEKNKVVAGDNSIEVTAGDNTEVKVKVKENAGLNVTEEGLAVDADALTQIEAGNGLDATEADNVKTLTVKPANSSIVVTAEGVKTGLTIIEDETDKPADILHQYRLSDGTNKYGVAIQIPKDKNLAKAYMGHVDDSLTDASASAEVTAGTGNPALCLVYQVADGTFQIVTIPISDFFNENAYGNGLEVNTGVVSVKIDGASESFITVSADGIKLSGIADAIAAAVKASSVKITESAEGHIRIAKTGDAENGYTYTITGNDIASAQELSDLSDKVDAITGQTGDTYAADSTANYIDDATSLQNADKILDTNLKALQDALTWYEANDEVVE